MGTQMEKVDRAASAVRSAIADASRGLIERESLVETVALAAVAGEHLLVVGPPGTAKSEAVRRFAATLHGVYFEYLLGRFTEPSEIFGPVDLRKLREGVVETETAGMLPEAEFAFLDEIFLGSTAILNTLLGILNERMFRRGHTRQVCPLRVCVGASNALPDDETLAAFADRFLVRIFLDPLPDPRLEELLEGGWSLTGHGLEVRASAADLDVLAASVRQADLSGVRSSLAHAIRRLRSAGITLSDRRAVKVQRLIAAAAILSGRKDPTDADLWPLVLAIPTREEQAIARDVLHDLTVHAENRSLGAVAEDVSAGPAVRSARLTALGRETMDARPGGDDATAEDAWRLKLEGIAREIDAGFAREALPSDLAEVRTAIVAAIQQARPPAVE